MMIGGGGDGCARADHGIGITEQDAAKFGEGEARYDFGIYLYLGHSANYNPPSTYSLNLWVR